MTDDERLTPFPGHVLQRLSNAHADLSSDALIDFVKDERRHDVLGREDDFEREHQARELTPRCSPS